MEVYIFRNKSLHKNTIWVCLRKPTSDKHGNYRTGKLKILLMQSTATFRKHFGFTIRPGKCMKTDLFLEEFGEDI